MVLYILFICTGLMQPMQNSNLESHILKTEAREFVFLNQQLEESHSVTKKYLLDFTGGRNQLLLGLSHDSFGICLLSQLTLTQLMLPFSEISTLLHTG
jgi:hypothetical protein